MSAPGFDEILPGLHRWRSGLRGAQQPVNSYVRIESGGAALIDPAADLTPDKLHGIGVRRVADIVITHFQAENAAGCVNFPDARVHAPAGDEHLAGGREAYEQMIEKWPAPWDWTTRGNYRGHLAGARNERPLERPLRFDAPLTDGAEAAGFRVVRTPGHGKNAVTLIAEISGNRVGFCGDLVCDGGQLWNWFDCDWDYGLQTGQHTLCRSAERLQREPIHLLCPAHGGTIRDPSASLALLVERLAAVLGDTEMVSEVPINLPEKDSPARGFREILPCLHQWRDGNCAVLVSETGHALMVDDGLCCWTPLLERAAHHRAVIADLKRALGIRKIEVIVPTHYHGDHIENIPDLAAMEGSEVVCLDVVAEVIEHPDRFNLASALPWYGTHHDSVTVHRKLPDGARLRWREFDLEFFHLGGQTHYALGLAADIHSTRTLFVGDAFHLCKMLCEPVLCWNKADPATAGWPYACDRMLERKPDLLVCGHGSAVRNPVPLLRRCREAWQTRFQQFKALSARADLRKFFDPFL
ncbi:MAG: MBL fold metallo-hydrolase [Verrucomicrobia bacterium]|nr:MBL fold metallo-hydrolase [Verrucomicrobiota bacterium]